MAKPIDDKDEKNPNDKMHFELTPNMMMIINNIVMIIVVVVSLSIMYVLLETSFTKKISQIVPEEEMAETDAIDERQEGILLDLGEFILNLSDTVHRRYLKVGVAMELSKTEEEMNMQAPQKGGHNEEAIDPNAAIAGEMERYKPAIRDAIISVLSNKTSDELSTPTGKEIAKEEILEMVNNIFEGQREVLRVSFGQFIIQ